MGSLGRLATEVRKDSLVHGSAGVGLDLRSTEASLALVPTGVGLVTVSIGARLGTRFSGAARILCERTGFKYWG